jgi:1L-myo-inositol 1-phosphate cytidylyltransferase / CDP-L-myo-inositol myo-inositolphosphotransferase
VPTRLQSNDGAFVIVGDARAVAAIARRPEQFDALPTESIGAGTLLNLATPADRRRSTREVLLATAKASDGWISRHVNRPVSRACSRAALLVGVSASVASFATLLVGLACAWFAAQPGYGSLVVTGVLFQLASVLDGVDGEIARATVTESAAGARIDTAVDQLTYVSCFAGITVGWMREGGGMLAIGTAVVIGGALILSLLRAGRFVAAHGPNGSFVFIDLAVRRAALDTGRLALRVAAALFTLLRRDLFAVIFLLVTLTGVRALVPALIGWGIVIANLTLIVYRDDLSRAGDRVNRMTGGTAAR